MTLNRVTKNFQIAKTRDLNYVQKKDYLLNPRKRLHEDPLNTQTSGNVVYKNSPFYMYGACESIGEDEGQLMVHNLLRRYEVWNGTQEEARKYLDKQIVVSYQDD